MMKTPAPEIISHTNINPQLNILELLDLLAEHKQGIIVNLKYLEKHYQRQSLKRVSGTRNKQHKIIQPWLTTVAIDDSNYVAIATFTMNHHTATINMLVKRRVKLVTSKDEQQISEVVGVLLNNLNQHNNYTLVKDGQINIPLLKVKINQKTTFQLLKSKGVLTIAGQIPEEFDFNCEYDICLHNLLPISWQNKYLNLGHTFNKLSRLKILNSIIGACLKHKSNIYDLKQLEELTKHCLSKNLYLNFPTTNEYQDLDQALANGTVKRQISYKIDLGNTQILNLSKLYSANKFLQRMYQGYEPNSRKTITPLTFEEILTNNIQVHHKKLSQRFNITPVDELMRTVFDDFLGLTNHGIVTYLLKLVKADYLLDLLQQKWQRQNVSSDEFAIALTEAHQLLSKYIEDIYNQQISPLIFYIGSTGVIPRQLDYQEVSLAKIMSEYPELKISKNERKGRFFQMGNSLITIYPQVSYYSVK